jgi:hypothetical protein
MQIARGDGGKKFFESLKKIAMVRPHYLPSWFRVGKCWLFFVGGP